MAVYKVPQDVEAEDKLIGPFSFRQFVFILIMVGFLYLTYLFYLVAPFLAVIPLPFAAFFGVLGLWPRKDQPVEVYLTALIHFWTQPRKKIWSQEGHVDRVVITAPKRIVKQYTDGLEVSEVKSRLHNLAQTLDSRGWSAKNIPTSEVGQYVADQQRSTQNQSSDRLVMPQVPAGGQMYQPMTTPEEDVLDDVNNPIGQSFQQMADKAEAERRDKIMQQMQSRPQAEANGTAPSNSVDQMSNEPVNFNPYPEMRQSTISPSSENKDNDRTRDEAPSSDILNLAGNSDWNVSTIARVAEKSEESLNSGDEINLH